MSSTSMPLDPLPMSVGPKNGLRDVGESSMDFDRPELGEIGAVGDRMAGRVEERPGAMERGARCRLTRIGLPGDATANGMLGSGNDGTDDGCGGGGCCGCWVSRLLRLGSLPTPLMRVSLLLLGCAPTDP